VMRLVHRPAQVRFVAAYLLECCVLQQHTSLPCVLTPRARRSQRILVASTKRGPGILTLWVLYVGGRSYPPNSLLQNPFDRSASSSSLSLLASSWASRRSTSSRSRSSRMVLSAFSVSSRRPSKRPSSRASSSSDFHTPGLCGPLRDLCWPTGRRAAILQIVGTPLEDLPGPTLLFLEAFQEAAAEEVKDLTT
jgi:hypothetical protein